MKTDIHWELIERKYRIVEIAKVARRIRVEYSIFR